MAEILNAAAYAVHHALFTWDGVGQGDTANPALIDRPTHDMMLQVTGTFSGSAVVGLEGSVDGVAYAPLLDMDGQAISLGAAGIVSVRPGAYYVRPTLTAGDGSADVLIKLLVRHDR